MKLQKIEILHNAFARAYINVGEGFFLFQNGFRIFFYNKALKFSLIAFNLVKERDRFLYELGCCMAQPVFIKHPRLFRFSAGLLKAHLWQDNNLKFSECSWYIFHEMGEDTSTKMYGFCLLHSKDRIFVSSKWGRHWGIWQDLNRIKQNQYRKAKTPIAWLRNTSGSDEAMALILINN